MLDSLLNFVGLERKGSLSNPSPELLELFGASPTAAGVAVNAETALW